MGCFVVWCIVGIGECFGLVGVGVDEFDFVLL